MAPFGCSMSWKVLGDSNEATFVCTTGDKGFGPRHTAWSPDRDAVEELYQFAETLQVDPRTCFNHGTLREKYADWKQENNRL
jgi:hypothetical protein